MTNMIEDRTWNALVTEVKAWAVFMPSLLAFCALAALAIGPSMSQLLGTVDPPWEPISAFFFWFGLLLFTVVRYAGRRPHPSQE